MKRFGFLLAGLVAAAGLALGSAGAASAASHPILGPVGTQYSQYLAGIFANGNGSASFAGEWKQFTTSPEPADLSCTLAQTLMPNSGCVHIGDPEVVAGLVMTQNLAIGGEAYGQGLVLNDNRMNIHGSGLNGCGAGSWTEEAGTGFITLSSKLTALPATDLTPVLFEGQTVCLPANVSDSVFQYEYHSNGHHVVHFSFGPSSTDWNVLASAFVPAESFRVPAAGITTTNGQAASLLTLGTVTGPTGLGVFESGHCNSRFGCGVNAGALNYTVVQGTTDGIDPPSVGNPATLTTSPLVTIYGEFSISAP